MIELPPTLKVGPYIYTIESVDESFEHDGQPAYAIGSHFEQTIKIRTTTTTARVLDTFIHEVLHAVDETYDIGLSHRQVHQLGAILAQILIDNNYVREVAREREQ